MIVHLLQLRHGSAAAHLLHILNTLLAESMILLVRAALVLRRLLTH